MIYAKKKTTIPTILGLVLILVFLSVGVIWIGYNQELNRKNIFDLTPRNIETSNISDSQISISYSTDSPLSGQVLYSKDTSNFTKQNDDRDQTDPQPRKTHYFTLKNLEPETVYFIKFNSNNTIFPDKPLEFKTGSKMTKNSYFPLVGLVLTSTGAPVTDALVYLKLSGASGVSTYTGLAGNFILPVADIRSADLGKFEIPDQTTGVLLIKSGAIESKVTVSLPPSDRSLPPIILGQNSDLSTHK